MTRRVTLLAMGSERAPLWTLIGIVVAFKIWGVFLMLVHDQSQAMVEMLIVMNWYIVLPVGLVIPPALWWWRLVRVRAKRRRLIEAEFGVRDADTRLNVEG